MNPDDEKEPDTLTRIVLDSLPKKKVMKTIPGPDLWPAPPKPAPEPEPPTVTEQVDAAYGQLSVRV